MKANKQYISELHNGFQASKGRACIYCDNPDIYKEMINDVISSFHKKRPNARILIVVGDFAHREEMIWHLNDMFYTENYGYEITVLSKSFIKLEKHYTYPLVITVGVNHDLYLMKKLKNECTFMLTILTKWSNDFEFMNGIKSLLYYIDTANLNKTLHTCNVFAPVEETRCGIDMSELDTNKYKEYSTFINECVTIFGSMSNIEKCKTGEPTLGISASEFRYNLACENGWRPDLDTSVPFMKQIDITYNPNDLLTRTSNFYNIARDRRILINDNHAKLEKILTICKKYNDKKIVIISKHGEFATIISNYLNKNSLRCGEYHNEIQSKIATDENGDPILIKGGANKGKEKIICAQAQSTLNEKAFNNGNINILSIKDSSDTKLDIDCNVVILTSSLYSNIIEVKRRFKKITWLDHPTKVFKLYCKNTMESEIFRKERRYNNITIINETEEMIEFDTESNSVII